MPSPEEKESSFQLKAFFVLSPSLDHTHQSLDAISWFNRKIYFLLWSCAKEGSGNQHYPVRPNWVWHL